MLDLAWSELALIALVALVVIGPKDLPQAVRGLAKFVNKARSMAGEFRGQLDEVVRESQLHEVKEEIDKLRRTDFRSEVINRIDPDGVMKDPFRAPFSAPESTTSTAAAPAPVEPVAGEPVAAEPVIAPPVAAAPPPPASFLPPGAQVPADASPRPPQAA